MSAGSIGAGTKPDAVALDVTADGRLYTPDGRVLPCALGRTGVIAETDKREGDGATPLGMWPLRRVFYRADRLPGGSEGRRPEVGPSGLPVEAITPAMGWCDDPAHPDYNRLIALPHPASHETLWREDGLYDIVVVLGHNDGPPCPGLGSAIFLHCARPDPEGRHGLHPTAGCVALPRSDLLAVLAALPPAPVLLRIR